jgi:hypothetical protein
MVERRGGEEEEEEKKINFGVREGVYLGTSQEQTEQGV